MQIILIDVNNLIIIVNNLATPINWRGHFADVVTFFVHVVVFL